MNYWKLGVKFVMSTKRSSRVSKEIEIFILLTYFIIPLWFFFVGYVYKNAPEKQEKVVLIRKIKIDRESFNYTGKIAEYGRDVSFTTKDLIQNPQKPQKIMLSRSQLAFSDNMLLFALVVFVSLGLSLLAFCMCMDLEGDIPFFNLIPPLAEFVLALVFFIFFLS